MKNYTVVIRMGAANWDARIREPGKTHHGWMHFNFRKMDKRQRSDFHREFMNAFRASRPSVA